MPIATLIFILDIVLIVHAAKTGRFSPWGYIILFLPGIGAAAYIVAELLPEWLGSYKGQVARQTVARAVNPARRYRDADRRTGACRHDRQSRRAGGGMPGARQVRGGVVALRRHPRPTARRGAAILSRQGARAIRPCANRPPRSRRSKTCCGAGPIFTPPTAISSTRSRWRRAAAHDEALAQLRQCRRNIFRAIEPRVRQAQLLQKLGRAAEAQDDRRGRRARPQARAGACAADSQRAMAASAQKLARG